MNTAHWVDWIGLLIILIIPIWLILRWNLLGLCIGVFVIWIGNYAMGRILNSLDPQRDQAMLDAIWIYFGWLGGLLYCAPIYAIKRIYLWRQARKMSGGINADSQASTSN